MEENNTQNKKGLLKLIFPVLLILFAVVGYFVYKSFFSEDISTLNSSANTYIANTRLGKNIDILNKENLSFTTSINDESKKLNFSIYEIVNPSQEVGRANPFLP
jgi:flagellar basal body-associated protein FliL